jgi:hypothetical protein
VALALFQNAIEVRAEDNGLHAEPVFLRGGEQQAEFAGREFERLDGGETTATRGLRAALTIRQDP